MSVIRVLCAQIEMRDGDYDFNVEKLRSTIARYGDSHDLIVFPETVTSGFASREDIVRLAESKDGRTVSAIRELSLKHGVAIAFGMAERDGDAFFNASLIVDGGRTVLHYRKTHLWVAERDKFIPGNAYHTAPWRGTQIGALICFDIEFPETARALAINGARLIAVSNGNMHPYGDSHCIAAQARAMENQAFIVMANRVGPGRVDSFAGGSLIASPTGAILAQASDRSEQFLATEIDLADIATARQTYDYLKLRKLGLSTESATAINFSMRQTQSA